MAFAASQAEQSFMAEKINLGRGRAGDFAGWQMGYLDSQTHIGEIVQDLTSLLGNPMPKTADFLLARENQLRQNIERSSLVSVASFEVIEYAYFVELMNNFLESGRPGDLKSEFYVRLEASFYVFDLLTQHVRGDITDSDTGTKIQLVYVLDELAPKTIGKAAHALVGNSV